MKAAITLAFVLITLYPAPARADTLLIVGVAVDRSGQRIQGALVRLCATSNALGRALAEDRTSERGIFTLYRTNIAGDIGDLYIIYDGDPDKTAAPLKVPLRTVQEGFIEARTSDLVILETSANATLTSDEAAERIAAITQTKAVLVDAGIMDRQKADESIKEQATRVMARVPVKNQFAAGEQVLVIFEKSAIKQPIQTVDPSVIDLSKHAAVAAIKESIKSRGGGTD